MFLLFPDFDVNGALFVFSKCRLLGKLGSTRCVLAPSLSLKQSDSTKPRGHPRAKASLPTIANKHGPSIMILVYRCTNLGNRWSTERLGIGCKLRCGRNIDFSTYRFSFFGLKMHLGRVGCLWAIVLVIFHSLFLSSPFALQGNVPLRRESNMLHHLFYTGTPNRSLGVKPSVLTVLVASLKARIRLFAFAESTESTSIRWPNKNHLSITSPCSRWSQQVLQRCPLFLLLPLLARKTAIHRIRRWVRQSLPNQKLKGPKVRRL